MSRLCLLLAIIFITSHANASSDFCDGFKRGYEAVAGRFSLAPLCPIMPLGGLNRPKSDYEFGYLKGVERAKKGSNSNQAVNPPVANNERNDCDCSRPFETLDKLYNREGVEERRQRKKIEKLRRQAEIEALNAQIRQSKAAGFKPKPKLTKSLKRKHDKQLKELNTEARNVKALIAKLGAGGNQETRQKNYDVAVAAFSAYVKNAERFFDDWTDPKYSR